ncbi:MAG: hypothetical protein F6K19_50355, partial [Cyanothece sp. SIO1E1]|nr:hypothetical protein [Cyanothece sp. SIO1E1]
MATCARSHAMALENHWHYGNFGTLGLLTPGTLAPPTPGILGTLGVTPGILGMFVPGMPAPPTPGILGTLGVT